MNCYKIKFLGFTIKDAFKREWVVGDPVGKGGFGMIYLCDQKGQSNDLDNARYVMKIEPKGNGPLFTEINYYQRNCRESEIDKFAKANKLKVLGIPKVNNLCEIYAYVMCMPM